MAKRTRGKKPPSPYLYQDMNDVPEPWRSHRSARLTVAQINQIMVRAYELGYWKEHENGDAYYVPDEGKARREFESLNENENGLWVPKKADS